MDSYDKGTGPTTVTRRDMINYSVWATSTECEKMFVEYLEDQKKELSAQRHSRSHFWQGVVPVATYEISPDGSPLPTPPTERRIIKQLRAIPMPGDDSDDQPPPKELLISPSGKPLFAAYVRCADGKERVHQLFEFAITAPDAGRFLPFPFQSEHCPGPYFGVQYERRRFSGTVHNLLPVFTLNSWQSSNAAGAGVTSRQTSRPLQVGEPSLEGGASSVGDTLCPRRQLKCRPREKGQGTIEPQLEHRPGEKRARAVDSQAREASQACQWKCLERQLEPKVECPQLEPEVEHPIKNNARAVDSEAMEAYETGGSQSKGCTLKLQLFEPEVEKHARARAVDSEGREVSLQDGVGQSKHTLELQPQERPLQKKSARAVDGKARDASEVGQFKCRTLEGQLEQEPEVEQQLKLEVELPPQKRPRVVGAEGREASQLGVASTKGKGISMVQPVGMPPSRCHPCFPCESCKTFWGEGLPLVKNFLEDLTRDLTKFVFPREEDVPPPLPEGEDDEETKRRKRASRKGPKNRSSIYRGVSRFNRVESGYWESHIWHNHKQHFLGASATQELAARAFDKAALVFQKTGNLDLNFKAADYKEEYPFLYSLSMFQMEIYLRREAVGYGEEVKYPGVKLILDRKELCFEAYYKHEREAGTREHVRYCATEEEAVRIVFREALRREDYDLAGKIMDTHHVRTVRPAPFGIRDSMSQDPPPASFALPGPEPAVHESAAESAPTAPAKRRAGQRAKAKLAPRADPPVVIDATPLAMAAPQPAQKELVRSSPAQENLCAALLLPWHQETSEAAHKPAKRRSQRLANMRPSRQESAKRRSERLSNRNLKKSQALQQLAETAQHEPELAITVLNFTVHPEEELQPTAEVSTSADPINTSLELQPSQQVPADSRYPAGNNTAGPSELLEANIPGETVAPTELGADDLRDLTPADVLAATTLWLHEWQQLQLEYQQWQIEQQQWELEYQQWIQYLKTFPGAPPAAILLQWQQWQIKYNQWVLKYHKWQLQHFWNLRSSDNASSSYGGHVPLPEEVHGSSTVSTDLSAQINSTGINGLPGVQQALPAVVVPFSGSHGPSETNEVVEGPLSELMTAFTPPGVVRNGNNYQSLGPESPASVNPAVHTFIRPLVRPVATRPQNLDPESPASVNRDVSTVIRPPVRPVAIRPQAGSHGSETDRSSAEGVAGHSSGVMTAFTPVGPESPASVNRDVNTVIRPPVRPVAIRPQAGKKLSFLDTGHSGSHTYPKCDCWFP